MLTDLLKTIMQDCEVHNVQLKLINDNIVTSAGAPCGGLFSHYDRSLTVAVGDPAWVRFLAHEWGHMQQAVEGLFGMSLDPNYKEPPGPDQYLELDLWLRKEKELKPSVIKKYVSYILECEMDADRRAVDLLCEFGVYPAEKYIQEANLVLYAYGHALNTRKWVLDNFSTSYARVIPRRFEQNALSYVNTPPALRKIFDRI